MGRAAAQRAHGGSSSSSCLKQPGSPLSVLSALAALAAVASASRDLAALAEGRRSLQQAGCDQATFPALQPVRRPL